MQSCNRASQAAADLSVLCCCLLRCVALWPFACAFALLSLFCFAFALLLRLFALGLLFWLVAVALGALQVGVLVWAA